MADSGISEIGGGRGYGDPGQGVLAGRVGSDSAVVLTGIRVYAAKPPV